MSFEADLAVLLSQLGRESLPGVHDPGPGAVRLPALKSHG